VSRARTLTREERLAAYEKAVAATPGAQLKGAKIRYTSLNGHMHSFLTDDGLALRLAQDQRELFLAKRGGRPCIQYGIVMKEYVLVPDALLTVPAELARLLAGSRAYVAGLKPKATTRKASAGAATKKGTVKKKAAKKAAGKKSAKRGPR
jgi:hypothetical protein